MTTPTPTPTSASTSTSPAVYAVSGMTCAHCVQAVTAEISKIAGVTQVEIDLAAGQVSVTSSAPVDDAAVSAAVEEAGYEVTAASEPESGGSCCGGTGACH